MSTEFNKKNKKNLVKHNGAHLSQEAPSVAEDAKQIMRLFMGSGGVYLDRGIVLLCNGCPGTAAVLKKYFEWAQIADWGEFHRTNQQIADDLGFNIDTVKSAKKNLVKRGFISVVLKGVPATSFITLQEDKIAAAIRGTKIPKIVPQSRAKNCPQKCPEPAVFQLVEKAQLDGGKSSTGLYNKYINIIPPLSPHEIQDSDANLSPDEDTFLGNENLPEEEDKEAESDTPIQTVQCPPGNGDNDPTSQRHCHSERQLPTRKRRKRMGDRRDEPPKPTEPIRFFGLGDFSDRVSVQIWAKALFNGKYISKESLGMLQASLYLDDPYKGWRYSPKGFREICVRLLTQDLAPVVVEKFATDERGVKICIGSEWRIGSVDFRKKAADASRFAWKHWARENMRL